MKKRVFISILLLLSIVITGCGSNGTSQNDYTDQTDSYVEASAVKEKENVGTTHTQEDDSIYN
jgi:uncharacterized protein YxeA